MSLEPHIARWWDIANERRARLIKKKYIPGGGLDPRETAEYTLLQGVCELIMSYAAPIDFSHLDKMVKKAEKLAERISKAALKAQKWKQSKRAAVTKK